VYVVGSRFVLEVGVLGWRRMPAAAYLFLVFVLQIPRSCTQTRVNAPSASL